MCQTVYEMCVRLCMRCVSDEVYEMCVRLCMRCVSDCV